jgi:hypothetical protein
MVIKAVNDTIDPNSLIPILLVFEAYSRISYNSSFSLIITKRAEAIWKTMAEMRKLTAFRQVSAALNVRNGSDPAACDPIKLSLQNEMRVWRENKKWQNFYKMLAHEGHNVILKLPNSPINFRSIIIVPYFRSDD